MTNTFKTKTGYMTVDWKDAASAKKHLIHNKQLKDRLKAQVARAKSELAFWQAEQKFWEEMG